jgi:hypothetical protein
MTSVWDDPAMQVTDDIQCEAARWDTGRTRRHTTTLSLAHQPHH